MGRTHSKPNSQAQTVGRVTRDTLKIHQLLHKPFDENPCFRPFFTETGAFHAGFRWDWVKEAEAGGNRFVRVSPHVKDCFIGNASDVATLRDALHEARGGIFVAAGRCPDRCRGATCDHVGEPLNASGKRERLTGPETKRVSRSVSYAANFGGLVRMLKCDSSKARKIFRRICRQNDTAWNFATFIHLNLPSEEENQYLKGDWAKVAEDLGLRDIPTKQSELVQKVRATGDRYRIVLRSLT